MNKQTIVIVDTKLLAYFMFHRGADIVSSLDLVYDKIMSHLYKDILTKWGKIYIVFVMDIGRSKRAEYYPEYKAHRKKQLDTKPPAYRKKQLEFEKDYRKMEVLYSKIGVVFGIQGLEADDLASIIAKKATPNTNIVFLSSDSDWTKFMTSSNHYMLHIDRNRLICKSDLFNEFEYYSAEHKLYMDIFCGVPKENIKGLKGLGKKTFNKIWNRLYNDLGKKAVSLEEITSFFQTTFIDKDKYLPVDNIPYLALVKRNYELLKPMTFEDLTEAEKAVFTTQRNSKEYLSNITYSEFTTLILETFERLPTFNPDILNLKRKLLLT